MSGREVVFAPGRAKRGALRSPASPDHLASATPVEESCPFCEGAESETPPEIFALGGDAGRAPDRPGWKVRVVPNLYPAFARQQVIVHSPAHARSLAELTSDQLALVASAWAEIADRAWREGFDHLFVFVNEGEAAGASREHSHSQAIWLDRAPPEIERESSRLGRTNCALCALLEELPPAFRLSERHGASGAGGGLVLAVSLFGRAPYELLIAPGEHLSDAFGDVDTLAAALELATEGVRRLHAVEGSVPFNLWLHSFPEDGHWHLELVPRLSTFAGIELGTGIYVNTLEPGEAASRLRAARPA